MTKAQKEAYEYKDSPMMKLRLVLFVYKFLYFCGKESIDFTISLIPFVIGYLFFIPLGLITFLMTITLHYFIIWKYVRNYCGFKLVSDKDREEIKEIIPILEGFIKDRVKYL
jgi:hypothetical protein